MAFSKPVLQLTQGYRNPPHHELVLPLVSLKTVYVLYLQNLKPPQSESSSPPLGPNAPYILKRWETGPTPSPRTWCGVLTKETVASFSLYWGNTSMAHEHHQQKHPAGRTWWIPAFLFCSQFCCLHVCSNRKKNTWYFPFLTTCLFEHGLFVVSCGGY